MHRTHVQPSIDIAAAVNDALATQPIIDMHTHLYPPSFGTPAAVPGVNRDAAGLMLWGVDELLTYHYLIAELFRVVPQSRLTYGDFFAMDKSAQADLIWRELFIERSPVSEACRGVLTTLNKLGMDTADRHLDAFRTFFADQDPDGYINRVMDISGVRQITMTNNVFDDNERQRWLDNPEVGADHRFAAVLRFDPLICDWPAAAKKMAGWGYSVSEETSDATIEEVRRFLRDWLKRTKSIYAAVSLPPSYQYSGGDDGAGGHCAKQWAAGNTILTKAVLPVCREFGIPFAMMIGSQRGVNPPLRDAGDMGFKSDVPSVTRLCREFPDNKFFCTMLSRENQHELAVAARKFGNLMVFGCWWFLNIPSMIEEMTRMRMELLGVSFIPQHSDARVLDQLIYKWDHSRRIIASVLIDKYNDLQAANWRVTQEDVKRDVRLLVHDNFVNFLRR